MPPLCTPGRCRRLPRAPCSWRLGPWVVVSAQCVLVGRLVRSREKRANRMDDEKEIGKKTEPEGEHLVARLWRDARALAARSRREKWIEGPRKRVQTSAMGRAAFA